MGPAPEPIADEGEPLYCVNHKREPTNLRCGRCEKPICHRCVIIGAAGPRCKECSKQNIAVRPGAMVFGFTSGLKRIASQGPWAIYIYIMIAMMLFGAVRGCMSMRFSSPEPPQPPPSSRTQ